jgi:hypothetical protein
MPMPLNLEIFKRLNRSIRKNGKQPHALFDDYFLAVSAQK